MPTALSNDKSWQDGQIASANCGAALHFAPNFLRINHKREGRDCKGYRDSKGYKGYRGYRGYRGSKGSKGFGEEFLFF